MEQTLGRLLQAQRKACGLTIQALATQAGVHRTTISRWERGEATPFAYELTRVLEILKVSLAERQGYYQSIEAPRAIQIARANTNADLPVSFGELLWALRQRAGVSQRKVARVAGVAQSLVVKWEKGECWPSNENLHAFCFAIGASQDELVFLTTRAWNQVRPLPQDKEALDNFIQGGQDDTDTVWAGVYLALAARYQSLYRAGKIGEIEALSAYGVYADYLAWRLYRFEEAKRIAAPIIADLGRSRGTLTGGQELAIACQVYFDDAFGKERPNVPRNYGSKKQWAGNLALLDSMGHRYSAEKKYVYHHLLALNWEKIGNVEAAEANYKHNLASASNDRLTQRNSWAYIHFLCRQRRFRDALPYLVPSSALSPRTLPLVYIEHWGNHAEVFAGLGDHAEAAGYLAQAVTYANQHSDPDLLAHVFARIGSLIK